MGPATLFPGVTGPCRKRFRRLGMRERFRFGDHGSAGEVRDPPVRDETAHEWGHPRCYGGAPGRRASNQHLTQLIVVTHNVAPLLIPFNQSLLGPVLVQRLRGE